MIKIKFNNETEFKNCNIFRRININVIMIDFNSDNISGFSTYNIDGEQLGDFSDYTTIYRKTEDYTYYSNDGSIWKEPTKDVLFFAYWDTVPDVSVIPDEITLKIKSTEDVEVNIIVKKSEGWVYVFNCLEHEDYSIISAEVTDFTGEISKNSVNFTYTKVVPTWQDEIEAQLTYTALCTNTLLKEE